MKQIILAAAFGLSAHTTLAQNIVSYTTTLNFDDVSFGVENAIIDQGFQVANISRVGDMLERTRADLGSDIVLFQNAEIYSFCSATKSRRMMESDPMNIAFCPYNIFVAQLPESDQVTVGFRQFPDGVMQEIQTLLDEIVQEAIEE